MPPRTKYQGESKQGLIITLVLFILLTMGLGVATYFGFAEQDKLEKDAKKAKTEGDLFKSERDYYKYESMMLRSYAGQAQGMDGVDQLGTLKGQFDSGSMKGAKDREEVAKMLKTLDTRFGWNGNQPKKTFEDEITELRTKYDALASRYEERQRDVAKLKKDLEAKDDELASARNEYQKNLKKQSDTAKQDFDKTSEDLDKLRKEMTTLAEANKKDLEKLEKDKKTLGEQLTKREKELQFQGQRVKTLSDQIASVQAKTAEAPPGLRSDWRIVQMDRRGSNPYINLGSADRVKPQLTFTIHGVGADGQVNPQPKGTLEVMNVINDHLSQTRITSVRDRNRDPITRGDVIYNPSWNPTIAKHVAIAGIIDLTGDGRNSLQEFIRSLERQNIVVDAYLDTKDGSVKGKGITFRTDYLIIGDVPEISGLGGRGAGGARDAIVKGRNEMQETAKRYGVPSVGLYRYLEMIGYRLPRGSGEERPSLYNPDLRPDQAPRLGGDNAPPPMPPEKNMPPEKK